MKQAFTPAIASGLIAALLAGCATTDENETEGSTGAAMVLPGRAPEGEPLYRTADVDAAAASIAWGNEATRIEPGETIRIDPPLSGADRSDDKVTVFELYHYGAFSDGGGRNEWKRQADELMERWKASLPERVEVVRIPLVDRNRRKGWSVASKGDANRVRMLMTAHVLGVSEAIDKRLVEALERDRRAAATKAEAKQWMREAGAPGEAFDEAWESQAVNKLVGMAKWQHVTTVVASGHYRDKRFRYEPPILVIDNQFIVASDNTTRAERVFEIANATIADLLTDDTKPSEEDLRWRALYDGMRNSYRSDVHWSRMRTPGEGEVFVLEPGLETIDDGRVEIEWFYTYINRGWYDGATYTAWLAGHTGAMMNYWGKTNPKQARDRIRVRLSPVSEVPGETPELVEHHRIHQKMVLGWGYDEEWGISRKVDNVLRDALGYYAPPFAMQDAKRREQALRRGKVPIGAFRRAWRKEIWRERAEEIDARFAEVNRQLREKAPHWLEAPRHPIVVIDGKFVIQGSISGGMVAGIQTASQVVRIETLKKALSRKGRS